jgi:hypothetical protein
LHHQASEIFLFLTSCLFQLSCHRREPSLVRLWCE